MMPCSRDDRWHARRAVRRNGRSDNGRCYGASFGVQAGEASGTLNAACHLRFPMLFGRR
jgi:hypothetical protein